MYNPYTLKTDDTHLKRLQLVYLGLKDKLTPEKIARYVDYSVSTIKTYLRKFKDLLEEAISIFTSTVSIVQDVADFGKGVDKCYLFKFYNNDKIVFSKIGTTARPIKTRLREEIKSYTKTGFDFTHVVIESIINCGEVPSDGAESLARAMFIRQYPNTFLKNDRFLGVDIPKEKFENLVKNYLTAVA